MERSVALLWRGAGGPALELATADITFDADGFVIDYPRLGRRVR
jgi:hypothetical protein